MHYLDEGAGETVLMLHGNPTWSFHYRDLVLGLRDRFRCVVPDHLGCGLSDKPPRGGYRIADHVERLLLLIERLDLRDVSLVVHDWGGPIGYLAALRQPGRFRRFCVFNTGVFLLRLPRILTLMRLPGLGALVIRGLNGLFRIGFPFAAGRPERFRGAVREGYLAPYGSWRDRLALLRFVQEIPLGSRHRNRALMRRLEEGLPTLADRPHLIVWGAKDPVFHLGYLDGWRARTPDAEVHALPDAGHWVVEEAPDEVLRLVRAFLDTGGVA
jgi:haloalkane dehalogenase